MEVAWKNDPLDYRTEARRGSRIHRAAATGAAAAAAAAAIQCAKLVEAGPEA